MSSEQASAETKGQLPQGRMEPMTNVGRQCAVYLGLVALLAGGVAFMAPLNRTPAEAQDDAVSPLSGDFTMLAPLVKLLHMPPAALIKVFANER